MTPRLLYIHVPKCGGTSFGSAVRLAYFHSQATISLGRSRAIREALHPGLEGADKALREAEIRKVMLGSLMTQGVKCISAHVHYSAGLHQRIDPERKAVTLLRDPVARFLSHYAYVQRNHPDPDRADTLAAFLESDSALRYGSTYLFFFASAYQHTTGNFDAAMQTARSNLARFSLIGDLSRTAAFRSALRQVVGRPLISWERNRRPGRRPSSPADIPPDLRARIEEICAPDIALYDYAQSLPACV
ncbi:sulfotransferase family protein [Leisingera thetidis]|uniref:sulfotransferase family protein n=1 Tax=Leisingera thetidis TaxID=2930199 RepID=UPI0021F787DE|nr:sulfotransferase family protein [Leisingera thetidis]